MLDEDTAASPDSSEPASELSSLYSTRGRAYVGRRDPETCITATIETVDDDRASSLLGVLAPSWTRGASNYVLSLR